MPAFMKLKEEAKMLSSIIGNEENLREKYNPYKKLKVYSST